MDAETGAMYAEFIRGQSDEVRAAVDAALAVDPSAIVATVIALDGDDPIGHAALRPFEERLEVKKVFVAASARGRGVARLLMAELESFAVGRGVASLVLQTGPLQQPAIALYDDLGYRPIPAYGAYVAIPGALCFEKVL
jgi:GNAT superfamily N-acetyltransferase